MRKLNHLKTYESFTTNEEFNPLKKEDWKEAGTAVRKGLGFLTPEEELEEGKRKVMSHPTRRKKYEEYLKKNNPMVAHQYLIFWANHEINATPVWNDAKQKFVDVSRSYSPAGSIAAGN